GAASGHAVLGDEVDGELQRLDRRRVGDGHPREVGAQEVGTVAPEPGQEIAAAGQGTDPCLHHLAIAVFLRQPARCVEVVVPRPGWPGARHAGLVEEVRVVVLEYGTAVGSQPYLPAA